MATNPKRGRFQSRFDHIISKSERVHSGPPVVYKLKPKIKHVGTLQRVTVGEKDQTKGNKTLLLVGETGTGKSTMINALLNHVMGVKWEDDVWFEIIQGENKQQVESQTSDVVLYEFFGFDGVDFSLTIIDTPGYGDTRGPEYDDAVRQRLLDLFRSNDGVHEIHAVGLVLKAAENRLNERLLKIFDSVVSLFGKDLEKNIVALLTHSDGLPPENAIQAILTAKIKCATNEKKQPMHFLFNNCQSTVRTDDTELPLENACRLTAKWMQKFAQFLELSQPKKLYQTARVLTSRIQLTAAINNLQERIKDAAKEQAAIDENKKALRKHKQNLEDDKNYTIEVTEMYKGLERYGGGWTDHLLFKTFDGVTRCEYCEENCHNPCTLARTLSECDMFTNGSCIICSNKCPENKHIKGEFKYVTKTRTVMKTLEDIKKLLETNVNDTATLLRMLEQKKVKLEVEITQLLEKAYKHVLNLQKCALTFHTMSTQPDLTVMIEKLTERGETEKARTLGRMVRRADN